MRRAPVPLDECGMVHATELLADRLSLLVLRELFYEVGRFDHIQAELGCSRSMLAGRLRRLEGEGLVTRLAYQEPGQRRRAAYALTERGRGLGLVFAALMQWGGEQMGRPAAELRHRDTGERLRVAVVDAEGRAVTGAAVQVVRADLSDADASPTAPPDPATRRRSRP